MRGKDGAGKGELCRIANAKMDELERIRNEGIRRTTEVREIQKKVQERMLWWYGHAVRTVEDEGGNGNLREWGWLACEKRGGANRGWLENEKRGGANRGWLECEKRGK